MDARMVLSLLALTSYSTIMTAPVTIHNDIMDLAHADSKYNGLKYMQVYCNNMLIDPYEAIVIDTEHDKPYHLDFILPANVVADLTENKLLRMLKPILYLLLCRIKSDYTPENSQKDNIYITEILIEKSETWQESHPSIKIRPGGWRTLSVTVKEKAS